MKFLTRKGTPAILGGVFVALMFSALSLAEADRLAPIDFVENHGVFHIIQAPVYALLIMAIFQIRQSVGARMTRLARFAASLATFGFAVGVVAGAIVPVLEFGFDVTTDEGTADAIIHMPEFMPYVVGTLLLGLAIMISRLLPRQYGALLAIGAIAMFVLGAGGSGGIVQIAGATAYGIGWVGVGLALREPRQTTAPNVALAHQV